MTCFCLYVVTEIRICLRYGIQCYRSIVLDTCVCHCENLPHGARINSVPHLAIFAQVVSAQYDLYWVWAASRFETLVLIRHRWWYKGLYIFSGRRKLYSPEALKESPMLIVPFYHQCGVRVPCLFWQEAYNIQCKLRLHLLSYYYSVILLVLLQI